MRILVVDDDSVHCRVVCEFIAAALGVRPETASDGAEAWWKLTDNGPHFDLVVTDVSMPVVSGLDLLERIRQTPKLAAIPVFVCSGQSTRDTITRAMALHATDYLLKPISREKLLDRLRHHLGSKGFAIHLGER